jgi:hypothetical protein
MARLLDFSEYVRELKHLAANEPFNRWGIQPRFIHLALCGVEPLGDDDDEFEGSILVSPAANAAQPEHIEQWRDYDSIIGFTYSLPYRIDLNLDGIPRESDTLCKSLHVPLPRNIEQNLVRAQDHLGILSDLDFLHVGMLGQRSL